MKNFGFYVWPHWDCVSIRHAHFPANPELPSLFFSSCWHKSSASHQCVCFSGWHIFPLTCRIAYVTVWASSGRLWQSVLGESGKTDTTTHSSTNPSPPWLLWRPEWHANWNVYAVTMETRSTESLMSSRATSDLRCFWFRPTSECLWC